MKVVFSDEKMRRKQKIHRPKKAPPDVANIQRGGAKPIDMGNQA